MKDRISFSMVIKLLGFVLSFLISIALSRKLGSENFGVYSFLSKYVEYFSVLTLFAADMIVVRSSYKQSISFRNLFASKFIKNRLLLAIFLVVMMIFLSEYFAKMFLDDRGYFWVIIYASIAGFIFLITKIAASYLVSYNKITWSIFTGQMMFHVGMFFLLLLLMIFDVMSLINAVIVYVIARAFTVIFALFLGTKIAHKNIDNNTLVSKGFLRIWAVNVLSVGIYGSDLFVVALLFSNKEIAAYAVATRLTVFFLFHIHVVNEHIKGFISKSLNLNDISDEFRRRTKQLRISSLVILSFIALFGKFTLSLWGPEYEYYYYLLLIISVGQFFNAFFGPAGAVLIMLGKENIHVIITAGCLIFLVVWFYSAREFLDLFFLAASYAIVSVLENVLKYLSVKKILST